MLIAKPQPYNSVWIQAQNQTELNLAFMRASEHYESANPEFKNNIFTIGQLKRWYSINYGADTYHLDWSGFNLPSRVLKPFIEGLFDPLTKQEKKLIDLFRFRNDDYYIIGAQTKKVLKHELCHALYAYNKKYKQAIDTYIKSHTQIFIQLKKYLLQKGYCKDVINDEIQAYILDNDNKFILDNIPEKTINSIRIIYRRFK